MDTKQSKYRSLIERVKASYPARNPSDEGNELRLYWCDDCKEIKAKLCGLVAGEEIGDPKDAVNHPDVMEKAYRLGKVI